MRLLVTIMDRGQGAAAASWLAEAGARAQFVALGRGTARSEWLQLLGIGDPAKDVVFSVLPAALLRETRRRYQNVLRFDVPGHGLAFTVPLSSVGGQKTLALLAGDETPSKEDTPMDDIRYELIVAIVEKGYADQVMDAARPAGAQGGTVVHARGAGTKEAETFLGITLQPEKEMVFILSSKEDKRPIMEAVCRKTGLSTEGRGIVFSLPATDVLGAPRMMRDE